MTETTQAPNPSPPARRRLRLPRLGIGWRLTLGLAAVAALLIIGEELAARTTRAALEAVRSMQNEHEPLANSANAVLGKLLAYDRAVGEFVQARSGADFTRITDAGDALEGAVGSYFDNAPAQVVAAAAGLRAQLTRHIANSGQLASRAAQRAQWSNARQAALNRVYQRIVSAGGSGLAINGTQVVATRSLAELESAINAVRGNVATARVIAKRERDFMALLDAHQSEFLASPGAAWLSLVRQDFQEAVQQRVQTERYDAQSAAEWHSLVEDSAALVVGVQEQLQKPARAGLERAAQHAASAAEAAEHTLRNTAAEVLGLLLLVSVLLVVSISLPVRRLTVATRLLVGDDSEVELS